MLLHTEAFTHRSFDAQMLLHTEAFTHRSFDAQMLLHKHRRTVALALFLSRPRSATTPKAHIKCLYAPNGYGRRACRRQLNTDFRNVMGAASCPAEVLCWPIILQAAHVALPFSSIMASGKARRRDVRRAKRASRSLAIPTVPPLNLHCITGKAFHCVFEFASMAVVESLPETYRIILSYSIINIYIILY